MFRAIAAAAVLLIASAAKAENESPTYLDCEGTQESRHGDDQQTVYSSWRKTIIIVWRQQTIVGAGAPVGKITSLTETEIRWTGWGGDGSINRLTGFMHFENSDGETYNATCKSAQQKFLDRICSANRGTFGMLIRVTDLDQPVSRIPVKAPLIF